MKKNFMFLALASLSLAGCGGFNKGDGGTQYKIVEHKSGSLIKEGDFVSLDGVIKTEKDSVLSSSYELGHPWALPVPKANYKGDLVSALQMLSEGDSAVIKINTDTMSKKSGQPKPPGFKGNYLIYCLRINKVISKGKQNDQAFQAQIQDYFKGLSVKAKAEEPGKIKKYIDDNKLNVTKTASGLNYIINKEGTGEKPGVGDTAVVIYTGKFTSGKVFDTNDEAEAKKSKTFQQGRPYKPANIPVGVKAVIPGWDEGLALLKAGSKATFIIPSALAYGEQGGGQIIPPYTPIIFEIELVKVIHPNPNAPKPAMPQMGAPAKK